MKLTKSQHVVVTRERVGWLVGLRLEGTMKLTPCKHLDYDPSHYPACKLETLKDPGLSHVRYWDRSEFVSNDELERFPNTAIRVQFCNLRGRINDIFSCYSPAERLCHEENGGE